MNETRKPRDHSAPQAGDDFRQLAFLLGTAGLIPFVVLGIALSSVSDPSWNKWIGHIQIAYGATILSFLGGVYWGLVLGRDAADSRIAVLVVSVVPQLMGWASLMMAPFLAAIGLTVGLAAMMLLDRFAFRLCLVPAWFVKLRAALSLVASASLLMTLPWH